MFNKAVVFTTDNIPPHWQTNKKLTIVLISKMIKKKKIVSELFIVIRFLYITNASGGNTNISVKLKKYNMETHTKTIFHIQRFN